MSTPSRIPEDVAALITAYALGVLEDAEAASAEAQIAADDDCRRAYEDALETAAALALAVDDREPPAGLRERIVAAAQAEAGSASELQDAARRPAPGRSWRQRLGGLLTPSGGFALAGVAAAIVLALVAVAQHGSADRARDRQAALVSILAAPDARVVEIAPLAGGDAGGRVVVSQDRAALISSLGRPASGRTYQAWGIPADGGAPVPLPTFSETGSVLILEDVGRYKQVAVTLEPSGGSQVPTTTPFAAATI
jgi:anti-sigma-K factor RskA